MRRFGAILNLNSQARITALRSGGVYEPTLFSG
jgi:hypothetical protein